MEVSQRLQKVAAHVPKGAVLADIGTDHGFLPIWLIKHDRIGKAFACDVRKGPLSRAEKHIKAEGLQEKICIRLSDGFEALESENVTAAVIAGMGGRVTAGILYEDYKKERPVLAGLTDLIVQPQSEWNMTRKALHDCGFCIIDEEMVEEKGQYYLIIHSRPGEERYDNRQYRWGRFLEKKRDSAFKGYLEWKYQKDRNLRATLEKNRETETILIRREELDKDIREIQEILERWR